jgi:hypothetical protein
LRTVDPVLPPSIDREHLRDLRVGDAKVDLIAWRDQTAIRILMWRIKRKASRRAAAAA